MASQDYYEEQTWKEHPETASLVLFVVKNIRVSPKFCLHLENSM